MVFKELDLTEQNKWAGRSRPLIEYSKLLGFEEDTSFNNTSSYDSVLYGMKRSYLESNDELVWVDLGCGNEIAQRQAKFFLKKDGIEPDRLIAYGVDLYPIDYGMDIDVLKYKYPSEFPEVLGDVYAPIRVCEDITNVTFPEAPNLITGIEALQWTEDPLAVFTNAVNQLDLGGFIGLHNIVKIYFTDDNKTVIDRRIPREIDDNLFEYLFLDSIINGSVKIHFDGINDMAIRMQKTDDSKFDHNLKLIARTLGHKAFKHVYAPRD